MKSMRDRLPARSRPTRSARAVTAPVLAPAVTIDGRPHDAAAEHHSPEESTALLRAELDACRAEILRLREALRFCAEERVVPGEDWEAGCGCCSSGRVTFPESVAATIASVLGRSS